jgi:hypothetical protein
MYKKLSIALLISVIAINHSSAVFGWGKKTAPKDKQSVQLTESNSDKQGTSKGTLKPVHEVMYGSKCNHNTLVSAIKKVKIPGDSVNITKNYQRSFLHPLSNGDKTGYCVIGAYTGKALEKHIYKVDSPGNPLKYPENFSDTKRAGRPVTPTTFTGNAKNLIADVDTSYNKKLNPVKDPQPKNQELQTNANPTPDIDKLSEQLKNLKTDKSNDQSMHEEDQQENK